MQPSGQKGGNEKRRGTEGQRARGTEGDRDTRLQEADRVCVVEGKECVLLRDKSVCC